MEGINCFSGGQRFGVTVNKAVNYMMKWYIQFTSNS